MRCWKHDLAGIADFLFDLFRQPSDFCARHRKRLKKLFRISQPFQKIPVPLPCPHIYKLGRCGIRILLRLLARQQKMKIIRKHQKRLCLFQVFRVLLLYRHQLINRIKQLLLNPGDGIQFCFRDMLIHQLVHSLCAAVPITICLPDQLIILIEQHIIQRPCIDSDARRNFSDLPAALHPRQNLGKQPLRIPYEMSVPLLQPVLKSIHLLQPKLPILDPAQHMPSAGCSNVNCQIILHITPSFLSVSLCNIRLVRLLHFCLLS